LVDVHANLVYLARKLLKLGQINVDHISVNEHLSSVAVEILCMELPHFFLNERLFLGCHPDDELLSPGSVLQFFTFFAAVAVFCKTGLGGAQQAQISNMSGAKWLEMGKR
jgi:hypothetical protein